METKLVGDHFVQGDQILRDRLSRGINFMGIVCPEGQEMGDRKFGDQIGLGPNASQTIKVGL